MRFKTFCLAAATLTALASPASADLSISKKPTKNVNCAASVCTATAKQANLNTADLTALLASGDVAVKTGGDANTIQILNGFAWASASRLTLDAAVTVGFHDIVAVEGSGAVTLFYNDGGSGGDLRFFDGGKLDFWDTGSALTINGQPYAIVDDIKTLASDIVADPNRAYAWARDYNAAQDGVYSDSPVPAKFNGSFEGLGHAISNLQIINKGKHDKAPWSLGFFAYLEPDAVLRDLTLSSVTLRTVSAGLVGALAGFSAGTITHAHVEVSATIGGAQFGCAVGQSQGPVSDVHASGSATETMSADAELGGLIGEASSTVSLSSSSCAMEFAPSNRVKSLSGDAHAPSQAIPIVSMGGLVGGGYTIDRSFATGAVRAQSAENYPSVTLGGLVGYAGGTVQNSYATGAIQASGFRNSAGGLLGGDPNVPVESNYAIGNIQGAAVEGGLVAFLVRHRPTGLKSNYWDLDTTGITDPARGVGDRDVTHGVIGLTDAQLKSGLPAGFDPAVWAQDPAINNGYPYLIDNPPQ